MPPSGQPPSRRAPRGSGRLGVLAVVLATTALLLSFSALVVSALALSRRDSAASDPAAARPPATTPPPPTGPALPPDPSDTQLPEPSATVSPGGIDPSANFTVAYQAQQLRIQSDCNGGERYVDLDEPRVGSTQGVAELFYNNCTRSELGFPSSIEDIRVAKINTGAASPNDCAEAIRTAPISFPLAPSQDLNLCIATSRGQAQDEGHPQKIVLVTINNIARDGTLNVTLTAWNVPA